jgi:REP element-mobilizing transposase RayT
VDEYVKKLLELELENSLKQMQIDEYIDSSDKGCYLNNQVLESLKEYLLSKEDELYKVVCFAVMPNHVHMLIQQKENLSDIIRAIKGGSAYRINKILDRHGKLWEKDYYDRMIRSQKHFNTVYEYIRYNPFKANLYDAKDRFYGIYEEE